MSPFSHFFIEFHSNINSTFGSSWSGAPFIHTDVCDICTITDDTWCNIELTSTSPSWPRTDSALAEGWYCFTGIGGDVLAEGCPSSATGGTNNPLSLCSGNSHPSLTDGVKAMSLCFPGNCLGEERVNVLACPGGFYLYYLYPTNKGFVTRECLKHHGDELPVHTYCILHLHKPILCLHAHYPCT